MPTEDTFHVTDESGSAQGRSTVDEAAATRGAADMPVVPRSYLTDLSSVELYRDPWVAVA